MKPNKKLAKVFRDAALRYLHDGSNNGWPEYPKQNFSCYAVWQECQHTFLGILDPLPLYVEYFKPWNRHAVWFLDRDYDSTEAMQEHRCLCLLMMAAILDNP